MSSCGICCLSHGRPPPTLVDDDLVTILDPRWRMNALDLHLQHPPSSLEGTASPVLTAARQPRRLESAANDVAAVVHESDLELFKNPLWIMAIALGVFCAFTASVIALG
jgi:hypothetical protein